MLDLYILYICTYIYIFIVCSHITNRIESSKSHEHKTVRSLHILHMYVYVYIYIMRTHHQLNRVVVKSRARDCWIFTYIIYVGIYIYIYICNMLTHKSTGDAAITLNIHNADTCTYMMLTHTYMMLTHRSHPSCTLLHRCN